MIAVFVAGVTLIITTGVIARAALGYLVMIGCKNRCEELHKSKKKVAE